MLISPLALGAVSHNRHLRFFFYAVFSFFEVSSLYRTRILARQMSAALDVFVFITLSFQPRQNPSVASFVLQTLADFPCSRPIESRRPLSHRKSPLLLSPLPFLLLRFSNIWLGPPCARLRVCVFGFSRLSGQRFHFPTTCRAPERIPQSGINSLGDILARRPDLCSPLPVVPVYVYGSNPSLFLPSLTF